nr:restriction endonuclease subunit S [Lysinibacillus timonensis]
MNAKQLKDSILHYAMQGKLVPQNPNDESASELMKIIAAEKEQLIKEGILKKEKPLPAIAEEDIPFDIPDSWIWVRLGEISQLINGDRGKNYPSKQYWIDEGIPFINAGALGEKYLIKDKLNYISEERFQLLRAGFINKNDLIYCLRGSLGKVAINKDIEKGAIASSVVIIRPSSFINIYFLLYVLKSSIGDLMIERVENGTAQPNISANNVKNYLIPLPPISIQNAIVEKLDEIDNKINKYAEMYNSAQQLQFEFPINLEKSILQYAMQGKLVEQNPNDEIAQKLIERILLEKEQLLKDKVIKSEKNLPQIKEEEIPFDIPSSWEWIRLGELATITSGSTPLKSNTEYYLDGSIPWITSGETRNSVITVADNYITEKALKECSLTLYPKGTLIMAMYGQGKTRGQVSELGIEATTNQACAAIELYLQDPILKEYVKTCLMSVYNSIREQAAGGAQPNLNLSKIKNILVPLPPLMEQKRIVEMVKKLLNTSMKLVK